MTANTGMHSLAKRNTGVMTRHEDKEFINIDQKRLMTRKDLVKISDRERMMIEDIKVSEKKRGSVWISPYIIIKTSAYIDPIHNSCIDAVSVMKKNEVIWIGWHLWLGQKVTFIEGEVSALMRELDARLISDNYQLVTLL